MALGTGTGHGRTGAGGWQCVLCACKPAAICLPIGLDVAMRYREWGGTLRSRVEQLSESYADFRSYTYFSRF
jgi:hypothetical protein